jgi:hypothetical protein
MTAAESKAGGLMHRAGKELIEYLINAAYLFFFFAAMTNYRRLLLASYDITYTNYGVALIEALILGKVVTIGSLFRIGRSLEKKPLILSTLWKTLVFTGWIAVFTAAEHGIKGLLKGEGFAGGLAQFAARGPNDLAANALILFVGLLPYFAVRELGRVLGSETLRALFLQRRAGP